MVGRLIVVVAWPNFTHSDLKEVLAPNPQNAVLKQFEKMFKLEDIVLEFTDDAIDCVAKKKHLKKT